MINRIKVYLLYAAGFVFLGLGIAGYVLPGLPGTIFLILSAGCFVRSNDRMYRWVTEHRIFGKPVKRFLETGGMPLRAKLISIGCIWIFSAISVFLTDYDALFYLFKGAVVLLAIVGTWYILSRPTVRS
ncbi:MAG: YbaN family protein [Chloroflexota bacterium]|nr:YbaN family protein [Chloroflexota bacterium]